MRFFSVEFVYIIIVTIVDLLVVSSCRRRRRFELSLSLNLIQGSQVPKRFYKKKIC